MQTTRRIFNFSETIESRFPGLMDRIRTFIEDSERKYQRKAIVSESFLWEHTTLVASFAYRLSRVEKLDPLIPVTAALFHDTGKFMGGAYHAGEDAEELSAMEIAKTFLQDAGMKKADVVRVVSGLKALYQEKAEKNDAADIVHDADFLAKFGAVGVAVFFIKAALRGRTLMDAVLKHLSRELTYAACLPLNMRTGAGRKQARKKASESMKYFRALLLELRESQIADLRIRRIRVAGPGRKSRETTIRLIVPPACPDCGGRLKTEWSVKKSVKCEKVNVEFVCRRCGGGLFDVSFCLPEIKS